MKQTWKKLLSIGAALAILLSALSVFMLSAAADVSVDDVQTAAKLYVQTYKNNATKEGLLEYVQTAMGDTSITLADADFFIKHAVPGATDVMADGSTNEYPLNIEGSDGAVVAIFGVGGARVSVSCAFAHEVEVIQVTNVAVADKTLQNTTYFTYDANGNITAFKGGADKIVIPADFPGAFETDLTSQGNDTTYDNVKVMIVNNQKPLGNRAYYSWNNLIAFQMADCETAWDVFPKPGGNNYGLGGGWMQFASCKKLKYVKFPSKIGISGTSWWTAFSQYIFEGCAALENINLPILSGNAKREMKKNEFKGTAVRDFFFPETYYYNAANESSQNVFTSPSFTEGTRNLFLYTDDMTFARAAALAAAEVNELVRNDDTVGKADVVAAALAVIANAHNAETLRNSITTEWADDYTLSLTYGGDTVALAVPFPADSAGSASLQKATEKYVAANENNATKEGLLEYVQTEMGDTSITLADADFFIKHAVPGVTDVMADGSTNEYPLNIEGSDGAVVAIFGVGGARVSVSCAFAHEVEVIQVTNVAVADKTLQDTTYFTYEDDGDIVAFKGGADKIVIPADFPGAFECDCKSSGNDSTYDNVKVMIVNNQKPLGNRAYYNWNNLIAFQMADSDTGWDVFPKAGGSSDSQGGGWMQFASCKKLKYVKFPSKIGTSGSSWWTAFSYYIFDGCVALENVNLPILSGSAKREMKKMEFRGTGVRDFFFPETYYYNAANEGSQQVFVSPSFTEGTRNLFLYTDDMTFARAAALAAAEVNELVRNDSTVAKAQVQAAALAVITNAHNAETLRNSITVSWSDAYTMSLAYAGDTVLIPVYERAEPTLVMRDGASVRLKNPTGLRFETEIYGLDKLDAADISYTVGTLICPTDYLYDTEFTAEALDAAGKNYLDIEQQVWGVEADVTDPEYKLMRAVISNIKAANHNRAFSARTYVDVTYSEDEIVRFYSDYSEEGNSRSVYYVATEALNDPEGSYTTDEKIVLNGFKTVAEQTPTMYVQWENETDTLQVVQQYSDTQDLVMVMKPIGVNNIFNVAPPKVIADTADTISSDVSSATMLAQMTESDWFSPHYVTGYTYTGGTHNYTDSTGTYPTGRTSVIEVLVNGQAVDGDYAGSASLVKVNWDNELYLPSTCAEDEPTVMMVEHYTAWSEGVMWHVECEIEFLIDASWMRYHGMSSVYGAWNGTLTYDGEEPIDISGHTANGDGTSTTNRTNSSILLKEGAHVLKMYVDNMYGLGNRELVAEGNVTALTAVYNSGAENGKAYFSLVNGNATVSAGDVFTYRGYYHFYSE